MIVKVCGLRDKDNIKDICASDIQMVGLNFYPLSSRFIASYDENSISAIPNYIKKVGVFVNGDIQFVKDKISTYQLDYVQLHGDEDIAYCKEISQSCRVIKVFRIDDSFDWSIVSDYTKISEYFLFDTKTPAFGGSGKKFSWGNLDNYEEATPFLLSGGIGPSDAMIVNQFQHTQFAGIDINSKFELAPAVKSKQLVDTFLTVLNTI
jgi:phosphoribosylanthranilate isomerase